MLVYGFLMQGIGSLDTSLCVILVTDTGTVSVPVLARGKLSLRGMKITLNYLELNSCAFTSVYRVPLWMKP